MEAPSPSPSPSPNPNPRVIQHVTRASSDQLLRKFATIDSDSSDNDVSSSARKSTSKRRRSQKKRKVINTTKWEMSPLQEQMISNCTTSKVVERKSLLPQYYQRGSRNQLAISRSHPNYIRGGARYFRTKSLLSAFEKTWSKTVRGASKIFMEKHYNRHRILIDDIV